MNLRWLDAGDRALTIEFGDLIAPHLVARVAAFDKLLAAACARGELPGDLGREKPHAQVQKL